MARRVNSSNGQLVCSGTNSKATAPKKSITDVDAMFSLTIQTSRESSPTNKPVDRITDTYVDDYDILKVDKEIRRKFQYDQDYTIHEYERKLAEQQTYLHPLQSIIERNTVMKEIQKYTRWIEQIRTHSAEQQYEAQVSIYLRKYAEMGPKRKLKSFKSTKTEDLPSSPNQEDITRLHIIASYLEIAQNYLQLDITRQINYNYLCCRCSYDMKNVVVNEETGIQECPKCHIQKFHIIRTNITSDSNKNVIYKNNNYDDRDNFIKSLLRDQGLQANRPPDILYKKLDLYFESYGLTPASEIRTMKLTARGTRGHSTQEMMMKALEETGNSGYYDDIKLICNVYWNWNLPDYSHIQDLIISDYDKLQAIYNSLPKKRTSNMNVDFRKFKHLQMRGYPCRDEDYKIIKTRDILEEYEELWSQMIQKATELHPGEGFVFYPTI